MIGSLRSFSKEPCQEQVNTSPVVWISGHGHSPSKELEWRAVHAKSVVCFGRIVMRVFLGTKLSERCLLGHAGVN